MQKKLLLLCLLILGVGIAIFCNCWGGEFLELTKQNIALKFYNEVVKVHTPQICQENLNEYQAAYHDTTTMFFPAVAYSEEIAAYEKLEGQNEYEVLAALENQQMEQFLQENAAAGTGADVLEEGSGTADPALNEQMPDGASNAQPQEIASAEQLQGGSPESQAQSEVPDGQPQGESSDGQPQGETSDSQPQGESEVGQAQETAAAAIGTSINPQKLVNYSVEKMKDFDYLRQTFYQIDGSTTIGSDQLNVEKLLSENMMLNESLEGAQILIYHTHSQEGYADSIPGDPATSVVGVGEYLTQILTQQYGFRVLHHTGTYDYPDRDHAYSAAEPALETLLAENPNIQVVIDLHRDGVADTTRLVTEVGGVPMAQIMFFNGLSRTTARGNLPGLKNPYIDQNLAFSFQMQLAASEYYPGLSRRIYLKGYRYNMHYCPKSLLVEVGAQTNTVEEAMNAMVPLADVLAKVLRGNT